MMRLPITEKMRNMSFDTHIPFDEIYGGGGRLSIVVMCRKLHDTYRDEEDLQQREEKSTEKGEKEDKPRQLRAKSSAASSCTFSSPHHAIASYFSACPKQSPWGGWPSNQDCRVQPSGEDSAQRQETAELWVDLVIEALAQFVLFRR